MNIRTFKNVVKSMLKHKVKSPIVAVGHAGIGKTQTVLDVGKEEKVPVSVLRIGSKNDVGDLLGMLTLATMKMAVGENYESKNVTVYAPPKWYREIQNGGILFLDEVNRGKPELTDALMQLLDARRLDEFELADDVIIVAAANPETEDYDVNIADKALLDRQVCVPVHITTEEIIEYAASNGWDQMVVEHLVVGGDDMDIPKNITLPKKQWTPRGERQLMQFLPVIRENPDAADEIIAGCVGPKGFSYWKHMEVLKKIPDAKEYLARPEAYDISTFDVNQKKVLVTRLILYALENKKKITKDQKLLITNTVASCGEIIIAYVIRWTIANPEILSAAIDVTSSSKIQKEAERILKIIGKQEKEEE